MNAEFVDWGVARRVAAGISGSPPPSGARPPSLEPDGLANVSDRAIGLVIDYSGLEPRDPIPDAELIDRASWSRAILGTLREVIDELEGAPSLDVSLPGPFGGISRTVIRAAAGTELGLAVGYASRRVLGQYEISLLGEPRPARLLLVEPNLLAVARQIGAEQDPFVRWVVLHETTHAVQFAAVPWLRDHLGGLIRELLGGALASADPRAVVRRIAADPRGALRSLLRGDLAAALTAPDQRPTLDAIQAVMTVIEGHAEHVMDGAAGDLVPEADRLRALLEARRAARGPLETVLGRLLGLDLKLRQYEVGRRFCDAVSDQAGSDALRHVWDAPEALPSTDELAHPSRWVGRVVAPAPA